MMVAVAFLALPSFSQYSSRPNAPRVPEDYCGVFKAPSCVTFTANDSVMVDSKQTWWPNGTWAEEGLWAPGSYCNRSDSKLHQNDPIVRYRLRGNFRDHGPEPRQTHVGSRKVVIDITEAHVTYLHPPGLTVEGKPNLLLRWQQQCSCGSREWKMDEEVNVLKDCADNTCDAFGATSVFLLASTEMYERKLCVSPRRSFQERWPMRQNMDLCMEKEAGMLCTWRYGFPPPPSSMEGEPELIPKVPAVEVRLRSVKLPVSTVNTIPVAARASNLTILEDGVFMETTDYSLGLSVGSTTFRTTGGGRWHHHGEHPFVPGLALLRFEFVKVVVEPVAGATVCLSEGCALPRVVLRLLCPCGADAWAADSKHPLNLLRCQALADAARHATNGSAATQVVPACSLAPLAPAEVYLVGGQGANGKFCLSSRSSQRFEGWGVNNSESISCTGGNDFATKTTTSKTANTGTEKPSASDATSKTPPGAGAPPTSSGPVEDKFVDEPGRYILRRNAAVSIGRSRFGTKLGKNLEPNQIVNVVEIRIDMEEQRVRGRLAYPDGWISLRDVRTTFRWAEPLENSKKAAKQDPVAAALERARRISEQVKQHTERVGDKAKRAVEEQRKKECAGNPKACVDADWDQAEEPQTESKSSGTSPTPSPSPPAPPGRQPSRWTWREHEAPARPPPEQIPIPEGRVQIFNGSDYTGKGAEVPKAGKFRPSDFGLRHARSMRIPLGWRVSILAPLRSSHGVVYGDLYPLVRTLLFDQPNTTIRLENVRPWLDSEEIVELEGEATYEVTMYDPQKLKGMRLTTRLCNDTIESGVEQALPLSLFGESSERFAPPPPKNHFGAGPPTAWQSVRVDYGYRININAAQAGIIWKIFGRVTTELIGKPPNESTTCEDLLESPNVIEVQPDCSSLANCSGHGFCRRPNECVCKLQDGWTGKRCDMQVPDGSSSIICDSIVAFVRHPLHCYVHARRKFLPAAANPEQITVKLRSSSDILSVVELEPYEQNATKAGFILTPKHTWSSSWRLFDLHSPTSLLADLSRAFVTRVTAIEVPKLHGSCEPRLEEDEGHFTCRIGLEAKYAGITAEVPAVPLKLIVPTVAGGVVQKISCIVPAGENGALCLNASLHIKVVAASANLTVELKAPSGDHRPRQAVVSLSLSIAGPSWGGRGVKAMLADVAVRDALATLGLPRDLRRGLWNASLIIACSGSGEVSGIDQSSSVPAARLAAAEAALESGNAQAVLAAVSSARRAAGTCDKLGIGSAMSATEIQLRSLGMHAEVEFRLLGSVEGARDASSSCMRSARGDREAEQWAAHCRRVLSEIRRIEQAVDTLERANYVANRLGWSAVLPTGMNDTGFAEAVPALKQAIELLPGSWGPRLDTLGGGTARRWLLELRVASCLGRADMFKNSTGKKRKALVNVTFEGCTNATKAIEMAEKHWPEADAFGESDMVIWKARIIIVRAEVALAADDPDTAMAETMKGMNMKGWVGSDAPERDMFTELLKRIVKYRQDKRGKKEYSWEGFGDFKSESDKHYEILGVARNATDAEVKKAYRQGALKWHPDKHPTDTEKAEAMFVALTEAYEYVMGDTTRQAKAGATGGPRRGDRGDSTFREKKKSSKKKKQKKGQSKKTGVSGDDEGDDDEDDDDGEEEEDEEEAEGEEGENPRKFHRRRRTKHKSAAEEEADGRADTSSDSLSGVPLPRHCCITER